MSIFNKKHGIEELKICRQCNESKSEGLFRYRSIDKNIRHIRCKKCEKSNNPVKIRVYVDKKVQKENRKKRAAEFYKENIEKFREKGKIYRVNNKEKIKARQRKYYLENKEKIDKKHRDYWIGKEDIRKAYAKKYSSEHKEEAAEKNARRRARKEKRTPSWMDSFDLDYIKMIYSNCKWMDKIEGITHHVDHIVPLKGKNVSGLHVPWNLQIITAEENLKKSNKLIEVN